MEIDIFNIQPHVVSRDLSGKSFLFYGAKKSGKTSTACKFPKPLLIAAEKGYDMISGIRAQTVNKWAELLKIKKQLLKDADAVARGEKESTFYQTIILDTGDLAYDFCEKYILDNEGVQYMSETENMRGYKAAQREFDSYLQEIVKAGYTLIVISHSTTAQIKEKNGEKYERIQPTLDKRASLVVSRLVDVIGYITPETDDEGVTRTMMYMRETKFLEAGSRNPYTSEKIVLSYENLRDDIARAIDTMEANGAAVTNERENLFTEQSETADFDSTLKAVAKAAKAVKAAGLEDDYTAIVEKYLGKGRLARDCTKDQVDHLTLILDDVRELAMLNGIAI
jgi:hypothetical protein